MPFDPYGDDVAARDAYYAKHLTPTQVHFARQAQSIMGPVQVDLEPRRERFVPDSAPVPSPQEMNRAGAQARLLGQVTAALQAPSKLQK
jgi:hypothetical protein